MVSRELLGHSLTCPPEPEESNTCPQAARSREGERKHAGRAAWALPRRAAATRRGGLRGGPADLERRDRPPTGAHRALRGADDVVAGGALRPRARPAGLGARRWPRRRRPRRLRRGVMIDLSLMKANPSTPRRAPRARRAGSSGGVRPGHPAVRAGHHRRDHQPHRDRRADARRRPRAPDAQARPDRRQPPRGRSGHRRWRADARRRRNRAGALLGVARRRRQLGIATAFEYHLHPVGPLVLGGPIFWPLDRRPRSSASCASSRPRRRTNWASSSCRSSPRRCRSCRPGVREAGDRADARLGRRSAEGDAGSPRCGDRRADRRTGPARAVPRPAVDARRRRAARHALLLEVAPRARLSDEVIDAMVARVETMTSPLSQLGGWAMGGAVSRVDPEATAVGERELGFELNIAAPGRPPTRTASATSPGCARAGRRCARTARRLRQLPLRRGRRGRRRRLRRAPAAADRTQGPLRPDERLPPQRQHPAERPSGRERSQREDLKVGGNSLRRQAARALMREDVGGKRREECVARAPCGRPGPRRRAVRRCAWPRRRRHPCGSGVRRSRRPAPGGRDGRAGRPWPGRTRRGGPRAARQGRAAVARAGSAPAERARARRGAPGRLRGRLGSGGRACPCRRPRRTRSAPWSPRARRVPRTAPRRPRVRGRGCARRQRVRREGSSERAAVPRALILLGEPDVSVRLC